MRPTGKTEYTTNETRYSKVYTWDCLVKGCETKRGSKSGGKSPVKYSTARKSGADHMDKYHPKKDRFNIKIRKWKPEDAKRY